MRDPRLYQMWMRINGKGPTARKVKAKRLNLSQVIHEYWNPPSGRNGREKEPYRIGAVIIPFKLRGTVGDEIGNKLARKGSKIVFTAPKRDIAETGKSGIGTVTPILLEPGGCIESQQMHNGKL
ncbi:hypothetical protein Trydic_g7026 [Trypoxylus dichotomus]